MVSAARRPLTVRYIDAMAVGEIIWDGAVRGLYVTYRREGHAKRYALKVRIFGRPRHIAIGAHGSPWTPDLARKEANRLLGQIAQGQDPAGDREIARATLTVRDVALRFSR